MNLENREDGAAAEHGADVGRHTPGPWSTIRAGILSKSRLVVSDYDLKPGDALLIAAAPDLLDALRECVGFCRGHQETPEKIARYQRVCAAIRKATGA